VKVLEQYVSENYIEEAWIQNLIEALSEFTSLKKLDDWDIKIQEFENELESKSLTEDLELLIKNNIVIATTELYGAITEHSENTLIATLNILEIANRSLHRIPNIQKFEFSKFTEHDGWGKPFDLNRL